MSGAGTASDRPLTEHYQLKTCVPSFKGFPVKHFSSIARNNLDDNGACKQIKAAIKSLQYVLVDKKWVKASAHPGVEKVNYLEKPMGPRKITPLMLLVIRGHTKAIKLLLPHVNVDAQDDRGWTALHHAAVLNRLDIQRLLIGAGASPHIQSRRHGSPRDYRRLCYPELPEANEHGYQHLDFIQMDPRHIIDDWLVPWTTFEDPGDNAESRAKIEHKLAHPLRCKVTTIDKNDMGESVPAGVGKVVRLLEAVKTNDILFVYGGVVSPTQKENTHQISYNHSHKGVDLSIDGRLISNPASRLPHSFPTIMFQEVFNVRGAPRVSAVFAITNHEPGSFPTVDYGFEHNVVDCAFELAPRWMRESLAAYSSIGFHNPYYSQYFFNNLTTLFLLIAEGRIDPKEIPEIGASANPSLTPTARLAKNALVDIFSKFVTIYSQTEIKEVCRTFIDRHPSGISRKALFKIIPHCKAKLAVEEKLELTTFFEDY